MWTVRFVERRAPDQGVAAGPDRVLGDELAELRRHAAVVNREAIPTVLETEDEPLLGPAEARRALDQRAQHRVEVEHRAADRLEHLAHGSLFGGQALVADGELHRADESLIEPARQAVNKQASDGSREREQYVQGAGQPNGPHAENQHRRRQHRGDQRADRPPRARCRQAQWRPQTH